MSVYMYVCGVCMHVVRACLCMYVCGVYVAVCLCACLCVYVCLWYVYVWVRVCVYVCLWCGMCMSTGAHGGQKQMSDPLELEVQAVEVPDTGVAN